MRLSVRHGCKRQSGCAIPFMLQDGWPPCCVLGTTLVSACRPCRHHQHSYKAWPRTSASRVVLASSWSVVTPKDCSSDAKAASVGANTVATAVVLLSSVASPEACQHAKTAVEGCERGLMSFLSR